MAWLRARLGLGIELGLGLGKGFGFGLAWCFVTLRCAALLMPPTAWWGLGGGVRG